VNAPPLAGKGDDDPRRVDEECATALNEPGLAALDIGGRAGGPTEPRRLRETARMKVIGPLMIAAAAWAASIGVASAQDAAAGAEVFLRCKACHQIGDNAKNMVGPALTGIVGRSAGTYPDYKYSVANKNSGLTWDEATLKVYLKDPQAKVPGTYMTFSGLSSDTDIDNVIAYLRTFPAPAK
jgi:cytochrome c